MNLALFPARGGSKRLTDKNIMPFEGLPIIAYPLNAARATNLFDRILVSTDSENITSVVTQLGFKPDFSRPDNLAGDMVPLRPVIRHALQTYADQNIFFESVCVIFPCAVLLDPSDILNGYEAFRRNQRKYDILTVSRFPVPVEWAFMKDENGILTPKNESSLQIRSQDLKPSFFETGTFAIFDAARMLENADPTNTFASIEIPATRTVDIDDESDLELARILFRGRQSLAK